MLEFDMCVYTCTDADGEANWNNSQGVCSRIGGLSEMFRSRLKNSLLVRNLHYVVTF